MEKDATSRSDEGLTAETDAGKSQDTGGQEGSAESTDTSPTHKEKGFVPITDPAKLQQIKEREKNLKNRVVELEDYVSSIEEQGTSDLEKIQRELARNKKDLLEEAARRKALELMHSGEMSPFQKRFSEKPWNFVDLDNVTTKSDVEFELEDQYPNVMAEWEKVLQPKEKTQAETSGETSEESGQKPEKAVAPIQANQPAETVAESAPQSLKAADIDTSTPEGRKTYLKYRDKLLRGEITVEK